MIFESRLFCLSREVSLAPVPKSAGSCLLRPLRWALVEFLRERYLAAGEKENMNHNYRTMGGNGTIPTAPWKYPRNKTAYGV